MNIEKIGEPIRVLASFAGGTAEPLRFRWSGRDLRVEAINGQWTDRQGDHYCLYYSVRCDGQIYYIHFSSKQVQWWLDEAIVE